jgi:DNA-binding winged helix-turn-helix (wHTH) protein
MEKRQWIINERFVITPGINSFNDTKTGKELRLEPRLMDVLCFLTTNVNQLVPREQLVQEIWRDYGGGDEGLTQAISFLRKILDDTNKTIIETIPKKGYILHAIITEVLDRPGPSEERPPIVKRNKSRSFWLWGFLLILLVMSYFIYYGKFTNKLPGSDSSSFHDSTKKNVPHLIASPKRNYDSTSRKNGPNPKASPRPSPD